MNHVYAKEGINSIVTGSDAGSGITYSTSSFRSLLRGYVSVHLDRVPVRDLVMITLVRFEVNELQSHCFHQWKG